MTLCNVESNYKKITTNITKSKYTNLLHCVTNAISGMLCSGVENAVQKTKICVSKGSDDIEK